jgi:hypothetical protein
MSIKKKIAIFVLSAVMALPTGLFSACKDKGQEYDPDNFIADTSNPQIVKEKITLKLFVPKSTLHGSWEEMKLFQKMEELTNIHIEFEEVLLDDIGYSEPVFFNIGNGTFHGCKSLDSSTRGHIMAYACCDEDIDTLFDDTWEQTLDDLELLF